VLPRHSEIRPAQLIQPSHRRRRASIQRQDVWADLGKDAVGCGLVRNIGRDRGDAQTGADGTERFGAAGNDSHLGAVRHERLDQPQAEATASASDDDILIFETHPFCSCV
jgi:hypothetical protein